MKLTKLSRFIVAIIVASVLCISCSHDSTVDQDYVNYINSEQYQKDLDNLFYYGALKQSVTAMMLQVGTNEFTATKGDSIHLGKRRLAYWGSFCDVMSTLQDHEKEFKESVRRLNYMRVFDVATPQLDADSNVVAMSNYTPLPADDPQARAKALLAPPAQAAPPLLFAQAFYEFFSMPSELAKESRKTIITVANKLSDDDRRTLFNNLDDANKMNQTDYKEWWNKFNDGKYDVKAHRVLKDILAQQDTRAKTNYMSVADDMDILNEKQFMSAAGRVVTAGAKLNVEVINKVLGNTVDGYSDVIDKMDQIGNTAAVIESTVDGTITMDQAIDYAIGTVAKAYVSEKTKDIVAIIPVPGMEPIEIEMDHGIYGGGEWVEYGQVLYADMVKDINNILGKDKDKLVWGNDDDRLAQIKIDNKDGKPSNMVIARDKNTGALFGVRLEDYDETTSTLYLPGGDYDVTAIGEDGDKYTVTGVSVEDGETTTIEATKKEREIFQKLLDMHADDSDSDFLAWLKHFKETWAEKKAQEATKEYDQAEQIEDKEITEQEEVKEEAVKYTEADLHGKWKTVSVDYVDAATLKEIGDKSWLMKSTLRLAGDRFTLNLGGEESGSGKWTTNNDLTQLNLTTSDFTGTHETFKCPITMLAPGKMKYTVSFHLKDYDEDDYLIVEERDVLIKLTLEKIPGS